MPFNPASLHAAVLNGTQHLPPCCPDQHGGTDNDGMDQRSVRPCASMFIWLEPDSLCHERFFSTFARFDRSGSAKHC